MKYLLLILGALLATRLCSAAEPARQSVTDPRPLMLQALQASSGEAHGVLDGTVASAISQRFASTEPILIDVTTLRRYARPGCARLQVAFSQAGVQLPGQGAPRAQRMEFGIDYCTDGMPPQSREAGGADVQP